jgi:hypothetical protein
MGRRTRTSYYYRSVSILTGKIVCLDSSYKCTFFSLLLRALPGIADSEEEVVTTRMEMSKMD